MQGQVCYLSTDCQFMYHCETNVCSHVDILPLSTYSVLVYIFAGLASAFCNIAGSSMGIFKMLILIILLHYQLEEATGLAQALVVGTAIPNFISVILKKHPNQQTSLVNYKLLLIILPCSLLGSTVGALGQTLIPKIGQILLLVLVFMYFSYIFIKKIRQTCTQPHQDFKKSLIQSSTTQIISNPEIFSQNQQKLKFLKYQKSIHLGQIFFTIALFLIFQLLSFLVQGKLYFYNVQKCSLKYAFGIVGIFSLTLIYLFIVFKKMKQIFAKYKEYEIVQQIQLDRYGQFLQISAGSFAAGAIQGLLGMGCGTCIMMVLLSFPIASTSASATSGYQILFTGTASLLQFYMNGQVQLFESMWMLSVCLLIGGVSTILLYRIIQRLNQTYVNRLIFSIITLLCLMSIGLAVPTVLNMLRREGWSGLSNINFKC